MITGGSRGIGEALVLAFANQGANVAFTYVSSEEKATHVANAATALGVKVMAYKSDAADFSQADKLTEEVIASFGKIDILINNAGITKDTLMLRMSEEQWDEVLDVNLKSVFNLTKASVRNFLKLKRGSIINMSSVVGVTGNAGQSNYSASKAGIIGFSKSVAKELGSRNIRCNVITPGFIQTEMTHQLGEDVMKAWMEQIPLKRGGTTDDVADLAVFLASDMSTYITGQVISVCGGMVM